MVLPGDRSQLSRRPSILGLVLARGGSKRVPRKNLAVVGGKPLISWTVGCGLQSGELDRLVVSTDDEKIASVARGEGADVPFLRPSELASDDASSMDAIIHALQTLRSDGYKPDAVMLLQPTSPLRSVEDIQGAIDLFRREGASVVLSVHLSDNDSPFTVSREGLLQPREIGGPGTPCRLNGAIYLADVDRLLQTRSWFGEKTWAFIMPSERSLDIDTPSDLALAARQLEVGCREITNGDI